MRSDYSLDSTSEEIAKKEAEFLNLDNELKSLAKTLKEANATKLEENLKQASIYKYEDKDKWHRYVSSDIWKSYFVDNNDNLRSNELYKLASLNNPIFQDGFAINTENMSVNAENVNITNADENWVKTVTDSLIQQANLPIDLMDSLQGNTTNNINNSFALGGVAVHVSQIAQISDELVYQVFNRVGDLVKEHMQVCTEVGGK